MDGEKGDPPMKNNSIQSANTVRTCAIFAAIAAVALMLAFAMPVKAHAATYKASSYSSQDCYTVKVAGAQFVAEGTRTSYDGYNTTTCEITMEKDGRIRTLATGAAGYFITNGKYLYYAKRGASVGDEGSMERLWDHRKHTIYRLNINTGAKKKIVSGVNVVPRGAKGSYLYYGKTSSAASDAGSLYALNLKTGKKRSLKGATFVGLCGTHVITRIHSNAGGAPLYTYKANGTGRKLIAKYAVSAKVKGSKVIYVEKPKYEYRKMQCSATGKNKKALTGWQSSMLTLQVSRPEGFAA